jgi:hypothetical protein
MEKGFIYLLMFCRNVDQAGYKSACRKERQICPGAARCRSQMFEIEGQIWRANLDTHHFPAILDDRTVHGCPDIPDIFNQPVKLFF